MATDTITSYYPYNPNHVLPVVFAVLIGISFLVHIWQTIRYRSLGVTFFMFWGGIVFTAGWVMRAISSYHPGNKDFYIAQTVLVLAGPPIYSAAEYNILGRLMNYLPMHAPLHPNRVVVVFIYLGALVESLTAVGGIRMASAGDDKSMLKNGATLVAIAIVLQGVVEVVFMSIIGLLHYRTAQSGMVTSKVHTLLIMLYGTSGLVLLRCIFRAVEKFSLVDVISTSTCEGACSGIMKHEWYLYAFEAAPMVLYTYWLNIVHPGRMLPRNTKVYLDLNKVEREGPGWIDRRSTWETFADPLDIMGMIRGTPSHEKFWLEPELHPLSAQVKGV